MSKGPMHHVHLGFQKAEDRPVRSWPTPLTHQAHIAWYISRLCFHLAPFVSLSLSLSLSLFNANSERPDVSELSLGIPELNNPSVLPSLHSSSSLAIRFFSDAPTTSHCSSPSSTDKPGGGPIGLDQRCRNIAESTTVTGLRLPFSVAIYYCSQFSCSQP
jgi:hypothetical protein